MADFNDDLNPQLMTETEYVAQLLRLSAISVDPDLDFVAMRRVAAICTYIDTGDEEQESRLLEFMLGWYEGHLQGFQRLYTSEELVGGSRIQSVIYGTEEITLGGPFKDRLKDLVFSLPDVLHAADKKLFWIIVVGEIIVFATPGGVLAAYHLTKLPSILLTLTALHTKAEYVTKFKEAAESIKRYYEGPGKHDAKPLR